MVRFSAQTLRRARAFKGLTQTELGAKVGMSVTTICRIERGERVPSEGEVQALLNALNIADEKATSLPVRQLNVASRVIGMTQRLKVQISLEQIVGDNNGSSADVIRRPGNAPSRPIVFYVPLDGLNTNETEDEMEDIQRPTYRSN